jgi:cyanophycin synthetase
LRTFIPSASKTPGRMNLFQFPNFEVLVDYAHNAAGLRAVGEFLKRTEATTKIGVIAGIGDRRDEDTRELGRLAAEIFDEIIIRHDRDLRGRSGDELNALIKEGIESVDPNKKVFEISNEMRAIAFSLEHAKRGSFVSIFTDDVSEAIKMVENFKTIQDRRVLVD